VLVLITLIGVLWLSGQVGDNVNARPIPQSMIELEGGGNGLGDLGSGPNRDDPAKGTSKERDSQSKPQKLAKKFEDSPSPPLIPPKGKPIINSDAPLFSADSDPFENLKKAQKEVKRILDKELDSGKGGSGDSDGPAGGAKGPIGIGSNKGPTKGPDPKADVLNQQRRREYRWHILASSDPDIHLKKLQALKVLLVVSLPKASSPALQYDLSKPTIIKEEVKFTDKTDKVRWVNEDRKEMLALFKALQLPQVPRSALIYLPTDLEHDMAERELAYQQRQEHEIYKTIWDVRRVDNGYENVPHIVQQILWRDKK